MPLPDQSRAPKIKGQTHNAEKVGALVVGLHPRFLESSKIADQQAPRRFEAALNPLRERMGFGLLELRLDKFEVFGRRVSVGLPFLQLLLQLGLSSGELKVLLLLLNQTNFFDARAARCWPSPQKAAKTVGMREMFTK